MPPCLSLMFTKIRHIIGDWPVWILPIGSMRQMRGRPRLKVWRAWSGLVSCVLWWENWRISMLILSWPIWEVRVGQKGGFQRDLVLIWWPVLWVALFFCLAISYASYTWQRGMLISNPSELHVWGSRMVRHSNSLTKFWNTLVHRYSHFPNAGLGRRQGESYAKRVWGQV